MKTLLRAHFVKKKLVLNLVLLLGFILINTTANAQSEQTRKYRITAYNAMDNSIISHSNIVDIAPAITLYLPNAFTPNHDGLNDDFGAVGAGIASFLMEIYNEWGELVFKSQDINKRWDGTFKGKEIGTNVFVYHVTAKGIKGGAVYKKGTVTLIQ